MSRVCSIAVDHTLHSPIQGGTAFLLADAVNAVLLPNAVDIARFPSMKAGIQASRHIGRTTDHGSVRAGQSYAIRQAAA
ncbi:hypothetical protein XBLMG947_3431 [Xanthomonas bromi]|uniref:Uncharacterized protein n=1 Tax=Xanthomonas bromi TaxID=56449 RepID=A0A1C3NQM6_9XANT|nr:hypothetical protein XbrCFBP1976_16915 [Xanthomonas bromi]SBV52634.1 hypothetical protein XBLMG947_3431 [Xanthomonas bromi]